MSAQRTPYTIGEPWASIPAMALKPEADPSVADFRIRSWREGDGVRVLVFAATRLGPREGRDREEQIASVLVPVDQSVEITATEKYNARRVTVSAHREPVIRRYTIETKYIDAPVRPWQPPQRQR